MAADSHQNLLIEAGAGTGKTTRLVKEVLRGLFIRRIPLEAIVALTFTNKAAGELKDRVGSALDHVLLANSIDALKAEPWWPVPAPVLTLDELQAAAAKAVTVLDRANISTIHSFAFSLLKLFPVAAGIDPRAEIDDKGLRFNELFRREWPAWLAEELHDQALRETLWMELFSKLTLSQIEEAARQLADFEVPPEHLTLSEEKLGPRLIELHVEIRTLSAAHPGTQKADGIARACEEVIGAASKGEWEKLESLSAEVVESLEKKTGEPTAAWNEPDLRRLDLFLAIAKNLRRRGDRVIALLTETLAPFVNRFRGILLSEGCLTHAALLYLSRDVVRNHPEIRAALKKSIRYILIDEFQDTDPLQAELLLYLAEMGGRHSVEWDQVKLEAGKLFIVGDRKQSIYRFRGADIAAYERIGQLIVAQGGDQETLPVNFRSQSQVIELVNLAFERIILPEPDVSPPYAAVKPHHLHDTQHPVQDVEIWLADSDVEQTTDQAHITEAENTALWIRDYVGKLTVYDTRESRRRPMLYRDVALIFKAYSPMDRFIEALRRHDIPFAVESERYFFTTPEVTDFVNLLRAAENPDDLLSLVGYLRGPMGGLTDEEILKRRNVGSLEKAPPALWLRTITQRLGRQTLSETLQYIFDNTFVLELAARSYHGDQTVANLLKLRRILESFAAEGVTTMGLLLEKLEEFFKDDKIEGESPLADENYNAVRLLTIHKAKGLEYPVVFLPSLHSELKAHKPDSFVYDWRTRRLGLSVMGYSNLEKLLLDDQTQVREAAEQNRILYVAMTRARERLVLSGGIHLKGNRKNTYFARLLKAWELSLENLSQERIVLGGTSISVKKFERAAVHAEPTNPAIEKSWATIDLKQFANIWRAREQKKKEAEETVLVTTPTGLSPNGHLGASEYQREDEDSTPTHPNADTPVRVGTLVHRFLEKWDFACEKCDMPRRLRQIANAYFAGEGLLKEPFPDPKDGEKTNNPLELMAVVEEAQRLLADFIGSDAWQEIKDSKILGREIPFFYRTNEGALMRGTMDILYRLPDSQVVIGDYKTGKTEQDYALQGAAYQEAVRRALGEDAVFKIISLREEATIP